ncbi:MAG: T9SS type A sorting domain-containing protein [Flavobacteriales bacterium]|nr:T9SS type A sorting domain-containing protein [Bacteroidota bacterium]MCB9240552.1 T9SS type A sorting domain-containing protein [Flavobacteriales bacterium]
MRFRLFALSLFICSTILAQTGAYTAIDFNGSGQYVVVSDNSALNSDSTLTVEAWINADSYGSNSWSNSIFCKHGWGSGNQGYVLRCGDNGKLSFNICNSSGSWIEAISPALMSTGKWYHVAGTFDGDTISVYINGQRVGTQLYSGSITPSSGLNPRIGDLAYNGGRYFDGKIDEVRVWSIDLEEKAIQDYMCRKVTKSHPNFNNLAGYWKLDEGTGTSAKDETGNATKNGLANTPTWVTSGAAIGDYSVYTYSGDDLSISSSYGDVLNVQSISASSTPKTVHVFVNYQATEQGVASGVSGKPDTTHYFGVYAQDPANPTFDIRYDYGSWSTAQGVRECAIDLLEKQTGYQGEWDYTASVLYDGGDSLVIHNAAVKEFVPVFYETDSTKIVTTSNGKRWFCGNDPVILTASGSDSFSYQWYIDGHAISGATSKSLSVDSVGYYSVKLTRNNTSCSYASDTMLIIGLAGPTVTFSSLTGVCEDIDSIHLSGGSPSGGIYSGQGVFNQSDFSPSAVGGGNYTLTYSYTDTNNCTGKADQTMTVYSLPKFNKVGSFEACDNLTFIDLDLYTPKGGDYTGKYVYSNQLRLDSAQFKNGYYPLTYSYTDGNGCSNNILDSVLIKTATPCTFPVIADICTEDDPIQLKGFPTPGTYTGKGVAGDSLFPKAAGVGTHTIIYQFTNALNCTTSDTQTVTIKQNGSVSWSQTINLCQNEDSVQLQAGNPSGGSFSGIGVSQQGYFHPTGLKGGSYKITYKVTGSNGCVNRAFGQAMVWDTTTITPSIPSPLCPLKDSFDLTQVITNPTGGTGYFTGPTVTASHFHPFDAGSGSHQLTHTYINAKQCVSATAFELTVLKADSVSLDLPVKHCSTDNAVLIKTYPSGGKLTGKGIIAGLFSPPSAGEGNHWVKYAITGSNGCPAADSLEVVVRNKPTVNLAPFSSVCERDDAFILTGGTPMNGVFKVDGLVDSTFHPSVSGKGQHTIRYRFENEAGCADSMEQHITVNPNPTKPTIIQIKKELKSSAIKGNQWYTDNGAIDGATNQLYEPMQSGTYYVEVTSDSGCVSERDTFVFEFIGIATIYQSRFTAYPNPITGDQVHLRIPTLQAGTLRIRTSTGEVVSEQFFNQSPSSIPFHYTSGVYILEWQNADHLLTAVLVKTE